MLDEACHAVNILVFFDASLLMVEKLQVSSSSVLYDLNRLLFPGVDGRVFKALHLWNMMGVVSLVHAKLLLERYP